QGKLRITKQSASAEKLVFQPQTAFGRGGDYALVGRQNCKNTVRLLIACFPQNQTRGDKALHFLFPQPDGRAASLPPVCNPDNGRCCPYRQTSATKPLLSSPSVRTSLPSDSPRG